MENGINERINLCLIKPNYSKTLSIFDIEVIYEMQNDKFAVKDINHILKLDFSNIYGFDEYKFEIIEDSITDTKP